MAGMEDSMSPIWRAALARSTAAAALLLWLLQRRDGQCVVASATPARREVENALETVVG